MGPGNIRLLRAAMFAVLATAALLPRPALAQSKVASANTSAIVLTPGSIVKTADMKFGNIIVAGVGGTVIMNANVAPTCQPSAGLLHTGACQSARFVVRGKKSQHVRIQDLGNTGIVTLTGPGGATMILDNMTITASGMTANGQGNGWRFGNWRIDDASGIANFWMGGMLHVAATQTPGVYNGTLTIEIQFN